MGRSRCWYRVGGKRQWWWLSAAVTQSKVKRRALSTHREGSSASVDFFPVRGINLTAKCREIAFSQTHSTRSIRYSNF